MGLGLMLAGGLTIASTRTPSTTVRNLALVGAAVTLVIGFLLFFHLA
jgi:hypothetical protein